MTGWLAYAMLGLAIAILVVLVVIALEGRRGLTRLELLALDGEEQARRSLHAIKSLAGALHMDAVVEQVLGPHGDRAA